MSRSRSSVGSSNCFNRRDITLQTTKHRPTELFLAKRKSHAQALLFATRLSCDDWQRLALGRPQGCIFCCCRFAKALAEQQKATEEAEEAMLKAWSDDVNTHRCISGFFSVISDV